MKEMYTYLYSEFLRRLIYSIAYVDWRKKRTEKMEQLLKLFKEEYKSCQENNQEYQRKVEKEIGCFESEEISTGELVQRLTEIKANVA